MRFTIPFGYSAGYVRKGKRSMERATLLGEVAIDIEEIRRPPSPAYEIGQAVAEDVSGWQRFRNFEGRVGRVWRIDEELYAEYCRVEEFVERATSENDTPFDVWTKGGSSTAPFGRYGESERSSITTHERILAGGELRSWTDDGGQNRAEMIAARAKAFKVVDGMVCVHVGEPILMMTMDGPIPMVVVVDGTNVLPDGFRANCEVSSGARFRLDRLDEAIALAEAQTEAADVLWTGVQVGTIDPGRLFVAQEAEHLNDATQRMLYGISKNLAELPKDMVLCWRRLKDALAETPKGVVTQPGTSPRGTVVPALLVALEEMVAQLRQWRSDNGEPSAERAAKIRFAMRPQTNSFDNPMEFRAFAAVVDRMLEEMDRLLPAWYGRERSAQEWMDEAMPMASSPDGAIQQILTRRDAVHLERALRMGKGTLTHEIGRGCIVLHYDRPDPSGAPGQGRRYAVLLSPDYRFIDTAGPYGTPVTTVDREEIDAFVGENLRRRDADLALGDGIALMG